MCSNYEKQLQGIQIQEAETRDQVSFLWGGGANLVSCCQPGELLPTWGAVVVFIGGAGPGCLLPLPLLYGVYPSC